MPQDYQVLALNPDTQEAEWVSIGSPQAAAWEAVVAADGTHGRFVEVPDAKAVDLTQSPFLTWTGMQPLPKSLRSVDGMLRRTDSTVDRRWVLIDRKSGNSSRSYTTDELMDRLRRRSKATIAKKTVMDRTTFREWPAKHVLAHPEVLLPEEAK